MASVAAVAWTALWTAAAHADPAAPQPVSVAGVGCPSAPEVAAALQGLLPGRPVAAAESPPETGTVVEVVDLGASFRVVVRGEERNLQAPRRCDERARSAALWVAMRLRPPRTPPLRSSEAALAVRRTVFRARLEVEVAGQLSVAPSPAATVTGGGSLRLALGLGPLGLAVGGALEAPTSVSLPVGAARVLRAPLAVDVRGTLRRGRFEGDLELGLLLPIEAVTGEGLATNRADVRLAVGLHAGLRARLRLGRVAPFLAIGAAVEPRPYQLVVQGLGPSATLPSVWLTAELGVALALRTAPPP